MMLWISPGRETDRRTEARRTRKDRPVACACVQPDRSARKRTGTEANENEHIIRRRINHFLFFICSPRPPFCLPPCVPFPPTPSPPSIAFGWMDVRLCMYVCPFGFARVLCFSCVSSVTPTHPDTHHPPTAHAKTPGKKETAQKRGWGKGTDIFEGVPCLGFSSRLADVL